MSEHATILHEAAVLVRREHSQESDESIERQGRAGMSIAKAADAMRAEIARLRARVEELKEERQSVEHIKALIAGLKMGELRAHQKALTEALERARSALSDECCGLCDDPGEYRDEDPRAWPQDGMAWRAWKAADSALREHGWKEGE